MVADGIAVFSRDVTKVFGRGDTQVHALRGIDLEIRLGELTMLVGPSGSGKTTLLSVITGLLDATSGELVVLGERPASLSQEDLVLFRRENLGFVFQQYNLIPALTAAENVAVPLLAAGAKRQQAVSRGKELLATLGMAHRAQAVPSELSGGEQQRVALARALVHEPRLIVCDEPDRKSTRLNSSHLGISYAVFCLKKKTTMRAKPQVQRNSNSRFSLTNPTTSRTPIRTSSSSRARTRTIRLGSRTSTD